VDSKPETSFSLAREVGDMADFYDPALSGTSEVCIPIFIFLLFIGCTANQKLFSH
jgi:hypothetical protein